MAGAFGTSLIFLLLLAATAILGGMLLVSASHSFLVVVIGTAAGNDAVEWPDEPYFDWLGRALLLLWLTAFWLVPVGITAKVLAPVFLPDDPVLRVALPAVPLFWLLFPVSVLSSLS
ncbi:MAG TPA: hypothetical protein VEL76_26180, partial [Gemmataceae bacterium]|nr:hypothetical protein [Gemmataceae bacterium]